MKFTGCYFELVIQSNLSHRLVIGVSGYSLLWELPELMQPIPVFNLFVRSI